MKKFLLLTIMCIFGLFGNVEAQQTIIVGEDGTTQLTNLPIQVSFNYSISQQIYTKAEMNNTLGNITAISFQQTNSQIYTRDLSIYMKNTDKEVFEGNSDLVSMTNADLVYAGEITTPGADQWMDIELQNVFAYEGGNILLCVVDNTGKWERDDLSFCGYETGSQKRSLNARQDDLPYNISDLGKVKGSLLNRLNKVQFTISSEPGLVMFTEDSIDLGAISLGEYWTEKDDASANVTIGAIERTIESITHDNDFFILSEIDYTTNPIRFNVTYDKEATEGTYNGILTVKAVEGDVMEVPMTAVVYNPVEPDVFELAREITFIDSTYSDTPDFTTLYDDYVLPNEIETTLSHDAVYTFSLEDRKTVKVEVEGEGGLYAIYRADSIGEGKGPNANNNYKGKDVILSTAFSYNFDDDSVIDDFTIQDLDEHKDHCWKIEDNALVSYSYVGWYDENNEWTTINKADERIITNEAYAITPHTVLTFDIQRKSAKYQTLSIEVTQDGENFVKLGEVQVHPEWIEQPSNKPYYKDLFDENGNYITLRRINIGEAFVAAGLEYGDYQISLHTNNESTGTLIVDNLALTERAGVYEAGSYYLVAAAKDTFTLNIELKTAIEEPEELYAPTNVIAKATGSKSILLSWDAADGALGYGIYVDGEWFDGVSNDVLEHEFIDYFEPETTHCFTVTTITEIDAEGNFAAETEPSEEACATTESDGVEEILDSFNIYPNPVDDVVFIENANTIEEVSISTITGVMVYNEQCVSNKVQVNVSELEGGVYIIKVRTENKEIINRFVKK